jgi:hypothetical protein
MEGERLCEEAQSQGNKRQPLGDVRVKQSCMPSAVGLLSCRPERCKYGCVDRQQVMRELRLGLRFGRSRKLRQQWHV